MNYKRVLFWLVLVSAVALIIRHNSEKNLKWVHWQRTALHTELTIQFKGGALQKIRDKMDVFLETYDSALSDQFPENAFDVLSRSFKNTRVPLNSYQQKLLNFIQLENQNYSNHYGLVSPFQIGVAEWLYYYKLLYQGTVDAGRPKLKSKARIKRRLNGKYYFYDANAGEITSLYDSLRLTLGGVSKGLALLELGQILEEKAVQNFLINAGGDIYYKGLNTEQELWRVGIRNPKSTHYDEYLGILTLPLDYQGLATSGVYEKFVVDKGKTRNHIINPFTGESITDKLSLTVLAKEPLFADFYATFLFLLPLEQVFLEAERLKIEVLVIDSLGRLHQTERMKTLFKISQKKLIRRESVSKTRTKKNQLK